MDNFPIFTWKTALSSCHDFTNEAISHSLFYPGFQPVLPAG